MHLHDLVEADLKLANTGIFRRMGFSELLVGLMSFHCGFENRASEQARHLKSCIQFESPYDQIGDHIPTSSNKAG